MSASGAITWNKNMAFLWVVGTPIGNLEDISHRALRTLKESDFVLCEDTRVTKRLLDHYGIATPTISYHQHTGELKTAKVMELLRSGKNLALVTDAGTPGISDPGSKLVSLVRSELGAAVKIESVPGPSALAAAISLAGIGFDRFLFLGFLPHKKGRQKLLREAWESEYSFVIYESKHRLLKFLAEAAQLDKTMACRRELTIARELTKLHESLYFGSAADLLPAISSDDNNLRGEFVVLGRRSDNTEE